MRHLHWVRCTRFSIVIIVAAAAAPCGPNCAAAAVILKVDVVPAGSGGFLVPASVTAGPLLVQTFNPSLTAPVLQAHALSLAPAAVLAAPSIPAHAPTADPVPAAGVAPRNMTAVPDPGTTGVPGTPVAALRTLRSVGRLTGSQADLAAVSAQLDAVYAGASEASRSVLHVGAAVGAFGPSGFSSVGVVNRLPGNGRAGISAPGGRFHEMDVNDLYASVESLTVSRTALKSENKPFRRSLIPSAIRTALAAILGPRTAAAGRALKADKFLLHVGDPVRSDRLIGAGVVRAIFENGYAVVELQKNRYLGGAAPKFMPKRYVVTQTTTIEAKYLIRITEALTK